MIEAGHAFVFTLSEGFPVNVLKPPAVCLNLRATATGSSWAGAKARTRQGLSIPDEPW